MIRQDDDEWAKQDNFEHATRIPFMMAGPGVPAGHREDALVAVSYTHLTLPTKA